MESATLLLLPLRSLGGVIADALAAASVAPAVTASHCRSSVVGGGYVALPSLS